ncbi:MAG: hypothetical protein HPY74_06015 [Firmicutes bacterium]|nr:hypothetical protein [Bacillota bacterium]
MISENEKRRILATKNRRELDEALKSIFGDKKITMADVGEEVVSHMYKLNEQELEDRGIRSKKRVY